MDVRIAVAAVVAALAAVPTGVDSHGRLIEPPSRSTMWRYGFDTPPNYNDHELYCGGFSRQWRTNGGKCGICGDPWDSPLPRSNEAGGMYGNGIIARKYEKNQVVKVRVELTANHMGFFEFRLCPNNNAKKPASQMCLDKNIMRDANSGDSRFYPGPGTKVFEMHYQLPKELTCRQCVLQWRYVAGNNWGTCKNGTGAVGCGPQEEFRACADVTITEEDGSADDTPNRLVDPDVYVPRDDDSYNEVDYEDQADYEKTLEEEVKVESIIIVALISLFVSAAFFALLFLYYTRGKSYIEKYVGDREWPEVHMPKMPSVSMPKMPTVPKVNNISWPLSNVQIKKLPNFMKKVKVTPKATKSAATATTISSPIQVLSNTANLKADTLPHRPHVGVAAAPNGGPRAPPRVKKQAPSPTGPPPSSQTQTQTGPRLATVGTARQQQHQHAHRPSAPPPVVPPSVPPVLEIGQPTAVTINGVSVGGGGGGGGGTMSSVPTSGATEEVTVQKTASSDVMGGMLVPARPAIADADMPDSMELEMEREGQEGEGEEVPPPLPTCPPPELDGMDRGVANDVSEA